MGTEAARLLIVDDEEFNRSILLRLLKTRGFEHVDQAENGRVALHKIRENKYDTILLDVMMPEMSGFDLLTILNDDMRLREIPVIMVSGSTDAKNAIRCIELGASDYLLKPIDPVLLMARLGACLERKQHADQRIEFLSNLRKEKDRADQLLNVILPAAAANELKTIGRVAPRRYENVGVLFCDIVGFSTYCALHNAEEVVTGLQNLFESLEQATQDHGMEKIKTIGDAFMSSAGLLLPNTDPLGSTVACALEMIRLAGINIPSWEVRCGVSYGPVIAGIVGHQRYQFDIWGDTVNMASRFSDIARPGSVALTLENWMILQDRYEARTRGVVEVKGMGPMQVAEIYSHRREGL